MTSKYYLLKKDIKALANLEKISVYKRFFKTDIGQYGAGDKFWGLTVPQSRKLAKSYQELKFKPLKQLLASKYHEERLIALLILREKYKKVDKVQQEKIISFYLENKEGVNNWDLVDLSVYHLLGDYLLNKPEKISILYELAKDKCLWSRRMAMVATYAFIKQNDLEIVFKIAKILINDKEDLIHKALGWMLREAGKKNKLKLLNFLEKHHKIMSRTSLRYSIEKFKPRERRFWLNK